MTAPVPYSPSTKFATQIGTCSPVNGLIATRPVSKPSFSTSPRQPRAAILRAGTGRAAPRSAAGSADFGREALDQRVLGREQDEGRAVDRVDARREDLDVASTRRSPIASTSGNRTRAPSDRPIQFRCIVRTFSGQSVEAVDARRAARRRSAVIRKNHCSRSRLVTGVPQRQQPPSTTCSLASTVWQRRAPVHRRALAVRQVALEHLQEEPLVPLVVVGQAGGDLALPGVADAEALRAAPSCGRCCRASRSRGGCRS